MIKAVLKNGTIQPLEPIPSEWDDGVELQVEAADSPDTPEVIRSWYEDLNRLAAKIAPKDMERLESALREADAEAKAQVRREMGLP